ncbi:hypothetical protein [Thiorhodococcus fuscus]|uniref:Lipoprotein n=1 Tax=Thiorhodococcus fuscus TaxID=527200 RepID=A0ABW4YBS6_9GAMM
MNAIFSNLQSAAIRALLVAGVVAVNGCSDSREDVRVVLCKDLALELSRPAPESVEWTRVETRMRRSEELRVDLGFESRAGDGSPRSMRAACFYRYDAVEDTALTLADPLSAYSTSPSRVILNGREVSGRELADAVGRAMLGQGRDLLERAQRGVEDAARQLGQGLHDLQSR